MSIIEGVFVGIIIIVFILIYDKIKGDKRDDVIGTLQSERKDLTAANKNLIETVQKTQQSQADQLHEFSKSIVKMQLEFQDVIDTKLKQQSEEVKKDITKMNNKIDMLLGLVMECDNEACPTKKKVSKYLKGNREE